MFGGSRRCFSKTLPQGKPEASPPALPKGNVNGITSIHSLADGMSYLVQRILITWAVLIAVLWAANSYADLITNGYGYRVWTTDVEAKTHAEQYCSDWESKYPTAPYLVCNVRNTPGLGGYEGAWEAYECGAFGPTPGVCSSAISGYSSDPINYYNEVQPLCEDEAGAQITHWTSGTLPDPLVYSSICQNSCVYIFVPGTVSQDCNYDDLNSSGAADDGDTYQCSATFENGGEDCTDGNQQNSDPNPQYFDCTNVDCSSDPGDGGGSGTSGDGGQGADQDPPGGPTAGPGDGDVDNPNNPGSGDGDVDGDGNRDLDCNPQSNPDCGFTGAGTGSADCSVQPSCSGDPVQCAILYQEWASMCYDPGVYNNPSDCNVPLTCEGDVLKCEIIRQERQQYCDLFGTDSTFDSDPTNNADFDRDLKDEATEIDLPTAFDTSGLGSGSCPADYSMATSLGTVVLSFATMCELAPFIRILVLISSTFMAAFIVIGSPGRGGA